MPKFLRLLFFVEMWERFSYYGMRALLVLFLVSELGFADARAYAIYALATALSYSGPVIGGWLADKWMGFKKMVIVGCLIMTVGHFSMIFIPNNQLFLYFGLGLIAVGTGLFKGNIGSLLGTCYAEDDSERDKGFTLFYVAVNVGSFLASVSCAYVAHIWGWHYGFGLAGIGMLLGLILFLYYKEKILSEQGNSPRPELFGKWNSPYTWIILGSLGVGGIFALMIQYAEMFQDLLFVVALLIFVPAYKIYRKSGLIDQNNLKYLGMLLAFFTLFFALELQSGSMYVLFADRYVDLSLFGMAVPASATAAINPLAIILIGPILPIFLSKWGHTSSIARYASGLLTLGLSFFVLYLGCFYEDKVPFAFLILSVSLIGLGELLLDPMIMNYVSVLTPKAHRGFFMGFFNTAISFSAIVGGWIAKFITPPKEGVDGISLFQQSFLWVGMGSLLLVVAYLYFAARQEPVVAVAT